MRASFLAKKMEFGRAAQHLALVPISFLGMLSLTASAAVNDVIPSVNYKILKSFDGIHTGSDPYGVGVTIGKDGSIYGTTLSGGSLPNGDYGSGTVYKIESSGRMNVLHVFDGIAGGAPTAAVTLAADGSLYGTTYTGGKQRFDTGIIYKIDKAGKFTILHNFDVNSQGRTSSEVTLGKDGSLYGTTFKYGTGVANDPATVFKLDTSGKYSVIHRFDLKNRELPVGGVLAGADGNLYGASIFGNQALRGSVYKIAANGAYQVLHQFNKTNEGSPNTVLTMGNDGSLYGTTNNGGVYNYGTVFRIDPAGNYSILHHFDGTNGFSPTGVSFGKDGKLYGIAGSLVNNGLGLDSGPSILYKLGLNRSFKILYLFKSADAQSKLTLAANGNLYGTERNGGQYDRGTVFRIGFPVSTAIDLTANKLTPRQNEVLTLTATFPGNPGLTGNVIFYEAAGGSKYLGYSTIVNGIATASFHSANLVPGTYTFYVKFQGNGYYAASTSKPLVITVYP